MIRRATIVQLIAFFVISLLGVAYVAGSLVGVHVFGGGPYTVKADFRESGGIFSNAEVTYRGRPVGRVGGLHLLRDGVRVSLNIDRKWHIPANTVAVVANQAPIGEQYVDLRPNTDSPPYLKSGDIIPMSRTSAPVPVENVIRDVDRFASSVDTTELATNISELGQAFFDTGPVLQRLITGGLQLNQSLTKALPQTTQLINAGRTDLQIVQRTAAAIQQFSQQLDLVGRQLATSDPDFRRFIDNGVVSAQELDALLKPNAPALTVLLGNLVSLNRITVARIPALKALFVAIPEGFDPIGQARHGRQVEQGFTGDPNSSCDYTQNQGNERAPTDTRAVRLDTRGYCNTAPTDNRQQRGQDKAPRPPGDTTANPATGGGEEPGQPYSGNPYGAPTFAPTAAQPAAQARNQQSAAASTTGATAAEPAGIAYYDPYTGLLNAPDGSLTILGSTGGQEAVMGDQSWTALLLSALFS